MWGPCKGGAGAGDSGGPGTKRSRSQERRPTYNVARTQFVAPKARFIALSRPTLLTTLPTAGLKQASESRPGLIAEQELDDSMAKDKETEAQVGKRSRCAGRVAEPAWCRAGRPRPVVRSGSIFPHHGPICRSCDQALCRYRRTDSGGYRSETQSMPVVQLAEWSQLRLAVPVPESAVPQIHLGSAYRCTSER